MRMAKIILVLFTFNFLLLTFAQAQDGGVPGALLNYGMSPRTIAMGKTFTGLADDQEAVYYNPAGLAQLLSHNIKTCYSSLWGLDLGYLGYALPTRLYGTVGVGIIGTYSDDIDAEDENGNNTGTYQFNQNCLIFSYANQPARFIGLGLNMKVVTSKIAQYGAVGVGADAGLLLFPRTNLTFGLVAQNIMGPKLTHYEYTDEYPITLRGGAALKLYNGRAVIAFDLVKSMVDYTDFEPHVGIEFVPVYPFLTLRAGLDPNTVNTGVGIRKNWGGLNLGVDYALELHYASSYFLPMRHKLGLLIDFGGFRTWIDASPRRFAPQPGRKENVTWMNLHYSTRHEIRRWQLIIKNHYGEVVRTYSGWDAPPLRLSWDGLDDVGRRVADGHYSYEIIIIDKTGERIMYADFLADVITLGPKGEIEFVPQE
jgi:hypothetical protein